MDGHADCYRALQEIPEMITRRFCPVARFQGQMRPFEKTVTFRFLRYILRDTDQSLRRLPMVESVESHNLLKTLGIPMRSTRSGWVWQSQQPRVLDDVTTETRFQPGTSNVSKCGIRSHYSAPLMIAQCRSGTLGLTGKKTRMVPLISNFYRGLHER